MLFFRVLNVMLICMNFRWKRHWIKIFVFIIYRAYLPIILVKQKHPPKICMKNNGGWWWSIIIIIIFLLLFLCINTMHTVGKVQTPRKWIYYYHFKYIHIYYEYYYSYYIKSFWVTAHSILCVLYMYVCVSGWSKRAHNILSIT